MPPLQETTTFYKSVSFTKKTKRANWKHWKWKQWRQKLYPVSCLLQWETDAALDRDKTDRSNPFLQTQFCNENKSYQHWLMIVDSRAHVSASVQIKLDRNEQQASPNTFKNNDPPNFQAQIPNSQSDKPVATAKFDIGGHIFAEHSVVMKHLTEPNKGLDHMRHSSVVIDTTYNLISSRVVCRSHWRLNNLSIKLSYSEPTRPQSREVSSTLASSQLIEFFFWLPRLISSSVRDGRNSWRGQKSSGQPFPSNTVLQWKQSLLTLAHESWFNSPC